MLLFVWPLFLTDLLFCSFRISVVLLGCCFMCFFCVLFSFVRCFRMCVVFKSGLYCVCVLIVLVCFVHCHVLLSMSFCWFGCVLLFVVVLLRVVVLLFYVLLC